MVARCRNRGGTRFEAVKWLNAAERIAVLPSTDSFPLVSMADEAEAQILANRLNEADWPRPSAASAAATLVRGRMLRCVSAPGCEAVEVWDASPATGADAAQLALSAAIPHRHASPRMDLALTGGTGGQLSVTQWRESSGGDVGRWRGCWQSEGSRTPRLVRLLQGVMSWQTLCI